MTSVVRRSDLVVAAAALLGASIALGAAPARATTQRALSIEDLASASDLVVIGRVVETRTFQHGPGLRHGIHTRVTLAAEEYLKGAPVSMVTLWVHGGRIGDRARVVPGQARFLVGERVLVFLFDAGDGSLFPTGMAQGKWEARSGVFLPGGGGGGPLSISDVRARLGRAVAP